MDTLESEVFDLSEKKINLRDIELPFIVKNHVLFSPGEHNGMRYSSNVIRQAFSETNWTKHARSLFLDHEDKMASKWLGYVSNLNLRDNGFVVGDLEVWDLETAIKLIGGAKFGVSPRFKGRTNRGDNNILEGYFENFSIVMNPAVKTTYLNSEIEVTNMDEQEEKPKDETPKGDEENTEPEEANDEPVDETRDDSKVLEMLEALTAQVNDLKKSTEVAEKPVEEKPKEKPPVEQDNANLTKIKELEAKIKELQDNTKRDSAPKEPKRTTAEPSQTINPENIDVDKGMLDLLRSLDGLPPSE